MGIRYVLVLFILGFSVRASAQVEAPRGFDVSLRGQVGSFRYTSVSDGVPRTILYYFPRSIQNVKKGAAPQKTFVFLHGGGQSTATDATATQVAQMYIRDFLGYAEARQVILIFPTTSFGWNGHTAYFLRNFIAYAESKIAIDDDHLILSGHSMGGMGITREGPYITDLFSGVLGLAAGTQDKMMTESTLLPYLNQTPYVHINGERDHFTTFKPSMLKFKSALEKIEQKYSKKAAFKLFFHPGDHNYDLTLTTKILDQLFTKTKIRSPKFFTARYDIVRYPTSPQFNPGLNASVTQVYWLTMIGGQTPPAGKSSRAMVNVSVIGQKIVITTRDDTLKATQAELALNPSLVDMNLPVKVTYNGVTVYSGKTKAKLAVKLPVSTRRPVKRPAA